MRIGWWKADLRGAEDTEHFQCPIPTLIAFVNISLIKADITVGEPLKKSISCSLSVTDWNGGMKKTVKTVNNLFLCAPGHPAEAGCEWEVRIVSFWNQDSFDIAELL